MVDAQKWLNENYPKEKRNEIREIYIDRQLEGTLDLKGFTYTNFLWNNRGVKVSIAFSIDKNQFQIINEPTKVEIIKCVKAQD